MMEQTPPTQSALSSFATDAAVAREVTVRDGGQSVEEGQDPSKTAVTVEHVADHNRRYPGETLTFFTRVNIKAAIPGFSLRVQVPAGLEITDYSSDSEGLMPIFVSLMQAEELYFLLGLMEPDIGFFAQMGRAGFRHRHFAAGRWGPNDRPTRELGSRDAGHAGRARRARSTS